MNESSNKITVLYSNEIYKTANERAKKINESSKQIRKGGSDGNKEQC